MPLYLGKVIGLSLTEIGIIFAVMHIAFIALEIPIGRMIDKGMNEAHIISIGFLIFGSLTLVFSLTASTLLLTWIILHFVSRIGASMVETGTDTHFFKNVDADDSSAISLYRNMAPLAYLVAPLIATALFALGSYALVFQGLTVLAILSIWAAQNIKHYGDNKAK